MRGQGNTSAQARRGIREKKNPNLLYDKKAANSASAPSSRLAKPLPTIKEQIKDKMKERDQTQFDLVDLYKKRMREILIKEVPGFLEVDLEYYHGDSSGEQEYNFKNLKYEKDGEVVTIKNSYFDTSVSTVNRILMTSLNDKPEVGDIKYELSRLDYYTNFKDIHIKK